MKDEQTGKKRKIIHLHVRIWWVIGLAHSAYSVIRSAYTSPFKFRDNLDKVVFELN